MRHRKFIALKRRWKNVAERLWRNTFGQRSRTDLPHRLLKK
jgi:hypothetical protein